MTYPVDIEKSIVAVRIVYGDREEVETLYREAIKTVNLCYERGRSGQPLHLLSDNDELSLFGKVIGHDADTTQHRIIKSILDWCREAYAEGREQNNGEHQAPQE